MNIRNWLGFLVNSSIIDEQLSSWTSNKIIKINKNFNQILIFINQLRKKKSHTRRHSMKFTWIDVINLEFIQILTEVFCFVFSLWILFNGADHFQCVRIKWFILPIICNIIKRDRGIYFCCCWWYHAVLNWIVLPKKTFHFLL